MGLLSSIAAHFKPPATIESLGKSAGIMGRAVRVDSANAAFDLAHVLAPDKFISSAPVGVATKQAFRRSERIVSLGARYDAQVVGRAVDRVGDITVRQVVMAPIRAVDWTISAAIALPTKAVMATRTGLGDLFSNLGDWIRPR